MATEALPAPTGPTFKSLPLMLLPRSGVVHMRLSFLRPYHFLFPLPNHHMYREHRGTMNTYQSALTSTDFAGEGFRIMMPSLAAQSLKMPPSIT